jgi:hypothetical protein
MDKLPMMCIIRLNGKTSDMFKPSVMKTTAPLTMKTDWKTDVYVSGLQTPDFAILTTTGIGIIHVPAFI